MSRNKCGTGLVTDLVTETACLCTGPRTGPGRRLVPVEGKFDERPAVAAARQSSLIRKFNLGRGSQGPVWRAFYELELAAPRVALALEHGDGVTDDAQGRELARGLDLDEEVVALALEGDALREGSGVRGRLAEGCAGLAEDAGCGPAPHGAAAEGAPAARLVARERAAGAGPPRPLGPSPNVTTVIRTLFGWAVSNLCRDPRLRAPRTVPTGGFGEVRRDAVWWLVETGGAARGASRRGRADAVFELKQGFGGGSLRCGPTRYLGPWQRCASLTRTFTGSRQHTRDRTQASRSTQHPWRCATASRCSQFLR